MRRKHKTVQSYDKTDTANARSQISENNQHMWLQLAWQDVNYLANIHRFQSILSSGRNTAMHSWTVSIHFRTVFLPFTVITTTALVIVKLWTFPGTNHQVEPLQIMYRSIMAVSEVCRHLYCRDQSSSSKLSHGTSRLCHQQFYHPSGHVQKHHRLSDSQVCHHSHQSTVFGTVSPAVPLSSPLLLMSSISCFGTVSPAGPLSISSCSETSPVGRTPVPTADWSARHNMNWLRQGFTSHSTQNRSFLRRSSEPISWHSIKESN